MENLQNIGKEDVINQDKIENARKRREEEKKKKTKYNDFSLPNPNLTRQRATS